MRLFSTKHEIPSEAPQPIHRRIARQKSSLGAAWHIRDGAVYSAKGHVITSMNRINLVMRAISPQDIDRAYASPLSHDARAASLGISYNDMHNLHEIFAGRVSNGAIVDGKLIEVTEPTESHVKVEPQTITLPIEELATAVTELDSYINTKLAIALRTLADLLEGK